MKTIFTLLLGMTLGMVGQAQRQQLPNIIVIFADDLGYGDLSCYGHPTIRTPHLDRMAQEGMRFTQFYVAANLCTPSRGALLTGRLPVRLGLTSEVERAVLFPHSGGGLVEEEETIAELLKKKNYRTAIIGKWHLGHLPQFLPEQHGFDYFFGLPYSNDMISVRKPEYPPLPVYKGGQVIETDPDQRTLTPRYTEEAIAFIRENRNRPFFLYYANNFPHVPVHASDAFRGRSKRGLYGDTVEELDWSVGQILKALRELKLDRNTLVIFASDNGAPIGNRQYGDTTGMMEGGSNGMLFGGKGSSFEGGMRVPGIFWWPGRIPAGTITTALGTTMDILPTVAEITGSSLQPGKVYDGTSLMPVLTGKQEEVRDIVYYYHQSTLFAVRKGPWKAHFIGRRPYSTEGLKRHAEPLLYNLDIDPGERYEVGARHPEILQELKQAYEQHNAGVIVPPSQLEIMIQP